MGVFDINIFGSSEEIPTTNLDSEIVFEVLSNFRRRAIIYYTVNCDKETMQLKELTRKIAHAECVREHGSDTEKCEDNSEIEQGGRIYQSVYISITQRHLPFLHDSNIISYDDTEKTISEDVEASPFQYMIQCLTEIEAINPEEYPD